ncbi:C-X-C motif chemokine 9-like [Notolabrus celidotus]|uniref:C-X-C motif chemokine 9-like n=1 Tax=Notolabrus celidotus TaxID=1203425 RepID=UPI00148FC062|nr:C-X-C motif chemokine 9-like [Notolabrus celidotus]
MSGIIKVFLLLAVMICISKAQLNESGQQCLCQRFRRGISSKSDIKDIQFYKETIFCNKVEIVVTMKSGLRYCLNPNMRAVKKLMARIMPKENITTSSPSSM